MEIITREISEQEVEKWLDFKKLSDRKKESLKENIDALTDLISDGVLVLREDHCFVLKLKYPLENEINIPELVFQPRLKYGKLQQSMQGVKVTDVEGRLIGFISALTSLPKDVIKALDTEDINIAQQIVIFFI